MIKHFSDEYPWVGKLEKAETKTNMETLKENEEIDFYYFVTNFVNQKLFQISESDSEKSVRLATYFSKENDNSLGHIYIKEKSKIKVKILQLKDNFIEFLWLDTYKCYVVPASKEKNKESDNMKLYLVKNQEGKYFRAKGYGGGGQSWVDEFKDARLYTKISSARSIVTFFTKKYPEYGVPEIHQINIATTTVLDEQKRVEKAVKSIAEKKAQREKKSKKNMNLK